MDDLISEAEDATESTISSIPQSPMMAKHQDSTSLDQRILPEEEGDHPQKATYRAHQETRSGAIFSPTGDNAHVTINHYYHIIRTVRARSKLGGGNEEWETENQRAPDDPVTEMLLFEQENSPRFDDAMPPVVEQLPVNEEKIAEWYYHQLDEYGQCYVQAVAILHGAKAQAVYEAADTLYRMVQQHKHPLTSGGGNTQGDISSGPSWIFPRSARRLLQKRTFTIARRVHGADCLFWQDVDGSGRSTFALRVLIFLAGEFLGKGTQWPAFLDTIMNWAVPSNPSAWRAAHALGVILWYQDGLQLQKKARGWAKSNSSSHRRLAASLLDGAREIELSSLVSEGNERNSSEVLSILDEWRTKIQNQPFQTSINVGCTIATTFGMLGKRSTDVSIALQRLDSLLLLTKQHMDQVKRDALLAAVVTPYISLTWAGHVRDVLTFFAEALEEVVHAPSLPPKLAEKQLYRLASQIRVQVIFNAFFLIVAAMSPSEKAPCAPDVYTQRLSISIPVPDPLERDLLLCMIVTMDPAREALIVILCALIVKSRSKQAVAALFQWLRLMNGCVEQTSTYTKQMFQAFHQFMTEIGTTLEKWDSDLEAQGIRKPPAIEKYKYTLFQLEQDLPSEEQGTKNMIEAVLRQLNETEGIRREVSR